MVKFESLFLREIEHIRWFFIYYLSFFPQFASFLGFYFSLRNMFVIVNVSQGKKPRMKFNLIIDEKMAQLLLGLDIVVYLLN